MTSSSITRAYLNGADGNRVDCQFNPSTVTISKQASWWHHPTRASREAPSPQFVGTGPKMLTAKLLFDGFDSLGAPNAKPVRESVQQLLDWTNPTSESLARNTPQPPTIDFFWGNGITFTGFLRHVHAEYTMFGTDGTPLRAIADIALQSVPDDPKPTNPSSGGISGRRSALLADCDSLAAIAYREYGDPGLWRAIAVANGIEDPARVAVGTKLLLPPHPRAAMLSRTGGEPGDDG